MWKLTLSISLTFCLLGKTGPTLCLLRPKFHVFLLLCKVQRPIFPEVFQQKAEALAPQAHPGGPLSPLLQVLRQDCDGLSWLQFP